ncbi:MAG: hypothetical protein WA156_17810 [Methylocystis silviterrae]
MLPLVRRSDKCRFAVPSRSSTAPTQVDDETIPGGLSSVQLQADTTEEDSDEQHRSRQ